MLLDKESEAVLAPFMPRPQPGSLSIQEYRQQMANRFEHWSLPECLRYHWDAQLGVSCAPHPAHDASLTVQSFPE